MDFDFDPIKSDRTLAERGFDFAYATRVFERPGRQLHRRPSRVRRIRMIAIGEIDGRLFTVVYTDRDDVRRIISAHRASRQESRTWQQSE
jgi:uncharacterized DUF497 family protein